MDRSYTALHRNIALAVLGLALILRLLGPIDSGLWFDEIWTLVDRGRLSFGQIVTTYGSDNNHPLYTLLAWLSMASLGESALSLRLPAIVFGVASVWALWDLGRRIAPPKETLLAVTLLALSSHHVFFSQNARGYTALLFFTLVSTTALVAPSSRRSFAVHAGALALATYVHLTGVFVAIAHLATLTKENAKRVLGGVGLAGAISLLLHAPFLSEMLGFLLKPAGRSEVDFEWSNPLWTVLEVARSFGLGVVPGLVLLGGGLLVLTVGTVSHFRQDRRLPILFFGPGVIGAAVMIGLGRNLWPRFFFFLAGFILLVLTRGAFTIAGWFGRAAPWVERLGVTVGIAGALFLLPRVYGPKQDFEAAVAWAEARRAEGAAVYASGLTRFPLERYHLVDLPAAKTPSDLAPNPAGPIFVLHTFPTFLDEKHPALAAWLTERGREAARFPGVVGGGDIVAVEVPASDAGRP